ncbi:signal peptidase I [Granulicella aggregans]|uniref:Signal peptidase I n=1 Tax=Granulicella aggregans TaxID=474949 RepID=A0A7W7ZF59_9BACT|nr:signal peptidase I [Granulicella aggregans]MBB5058716.1 signal peptidase I [Granulicella aggregans]
MSDVLHNPSAAVATEVLAPAGGSIASTEPSAASVPSAAPNPRSPESHGMIHAVQSLLYIIIIAIFIITFTVQPFRIPSESMDPTLLVGDFLLVAKQNFPTTSGSIPLPSTPIRRGDVIVFHFPVDPSIHLVKRVIGLPGDHLHLHGNRVYIDGQPLPEPYAVYRSGPADPFRDNFPRLSNPDPDVASAWWIQMRSLVNHGELTVPPHSYFVLGDNRNNSEDSRYWGFVPASAIVGKPLLIYFSVNSASRPDEDDDATPDTRDPDPTPRVSAQPIVKAAKTSTLGEIANFARWNRVLRVVR